MIEDAICQQTPPLSTPDPHEASAKCEKSVPSEGGDTISPPLTRRSLAPLRSVGANLPSERLLKLVPIRAIKLTRAIRSAGSVGRFAEGVWSRWLTTSESIE